MLVYVLTEEPYHDNSSILGVFASEKVALDVLQSTPDPTNINEDDYRLTEWDTATNTRGREWGMTGRQVREVGPVPWSDREQSRAVRKDFTFTAPDDAEDRS